VPEATNLLANITKKTAKSLPAPAVQIDTDLRERMARVITHAKDESDLLFPEDADVLDCFNIVSSAFIDNLARCGSLVDAVRETFPRLSGRRARTPAKVGTSLLELMRSASTTVAEYNRDVFARAGLSPISIANTLQHILLDPDVPPNVKMDAIKLADKFCDFAATAPRVPGGPSVIVPVQVNAGRPGRPKGRGKAQEFTEAEWTEAGKEVKDAIFEKGGGPANVAKQKASASAVEDLEGQTQFPWGEDGEPGVV